MANTRENRIDTLEKRLKALKAQQSKDDARRRTVRNRKKRSDDTRRKILVGAIVLAKIDQGVLERAKLMEWLNVALERPDDRALFELDCPAPPLPTSS